MLKITRHEKLCKSPAYDLAIAEVIELHRKYGAYPEVPYDKKCIVGSIDGEAVAVICYTEQDWIQTTFVNLGCVHREHRKHGHYRALFLELQNIARELGHKFIRSGYYVANDDSAAMHAALGRKIEGHFTVFDVQKVESAEV